MSCVGCYVSSDIDNLGYFPPILGLFWAFSDYLRLNLGYLPLMHWHINMYCLLLCHVSDVIYFTCGFVRVVSVINRTYPVKLNVQ